MREQLLGYLMGALDEAESADVQAALECDPKLAAECAQLEQQIAPLSEDESWIDPPPRLAERTIAWVGAQADRVDHASDDETPILASLSQSADMNATHRRWTLADVVVAAGVCAAAAMLFVPAIANSRQQAAIVQCQNNLQQLGVALVRYSPNHQGEFPLVPAVGKMSFSGVYAPLLKEAGLLEDDNVLLCPTSPIAAEKDDFVVPTTEEILQADGKELTLLQRKLGGSYGYALGYQNDDGQYCANLNRNRPRFALLSDAPSLHLKDRTSANHGGCGQNVLFEDGHVEYLKGCCMTETADNLFLSDRGFVEAGRHYNDAVIADSPSGPVLKSR